MLPATKTLAFIAVLCILSWGVFSTIPAAAKGGYRVNREDTPQEIAALIGQIQLVSAIERSLALQETNAVEQLVSSFDAELRRPIPEVVRSDIKALLRRADAAKSALNEERTKIEGLQLLYRAADLSGLVAQLCNSKRQKTYPLGAPLRTACTALPQYTAPAIRDTLAATLARYADLQFHEGQALHRLSASLLSVQLQYTKSLNQHYKIAQPGAATIEAGSAAAVAQIKSDRERTSCASAMAAWLATMAKANAAQKPSERKTMGQIAEESRSEASSRS